MGTKLVSTWIPLGLLVRSEENGRIIPNPAPVRGWQGLKGVPSLKTELGSLDDESNFFDTSQASNSIFGDELLFAGKASIGFVGSAHFPIKLNVFALVEEVKWMGHDAHSAVGRHWLQASLAESHADLAVPACLPMLNLMLATAVVDA